MRIGFLIDRWEPERGGAERALAGLASALSFRGHQIQICAERADARALQAGPGDPATYSWTPVRARGWTRSSRERARATALEEAARAADCELTIGVRHLNRVDLYWPHGGLHAATLEARWGLPGQLSAAQVAARARGRHRTFLAFEHQLLERAGAGRVLCVSELVRTELQRFHPAALERAVCIPNGVDLERFANRERARTSQALRARYGLQPDVPLIAFIARDPRLKGLPELARVLRTIERPWFLFVLGPARARTWQRHLTRAGLPRERFVVEPDGDSAELLGAADLCAHPTWRDSCALVVLEALAAGTPVVTTALAGAACVLEGRPECGSVIATPADRAGLRRALQTWLERGSTADRPAIRAAVAERDAASWMERLVAEVESAALAPR